MISGNRQNLTWKPLDAKLFLYNEVKQMTTAARADSRNMMGYKPEGIIKRSDRSKSNGPDLYSGVTRFECRPGYRIL